MTGRELHWTVGGEDFSVRIDQGAIYTNSQTAEYRIVERSAHGAIVEFDGRIHRVFMARDRKGCTVWWNGRTFRLERGGGSQAAHESSPSVGNGEIRASMPGRVLRIEVETDAVVQEKQALLVMESMKMETTIHAPMAGRVGEIRVTAGQVVEMGELLLTIQ